MMNILKRIFIAALAALAALAIVSPLPAQDAGYVPGNLRVRGNITGAGDVSVGDDLTVTDDASIVGDLVVTGSITGAGGASSGTTVYTPATQAITAVGNTLTATPTMKVLNPDGNYTITSTPSIANGTDGQILILTVAAGEANTVTLQDQATLASSGVLLGATTRTVGGSACLVVRYDGTDWREIGFYPDLGAYNFASAKVQALTSGRVVMAGTSGVLADDSDLTFSGATLTATGLAVGATGATITGALDANGATTLAGFTVDTATSATLTGTATFHRTGYTRVFTKADIITGSGWVVNASGYGGYTLAQSLSNKVIVYPLDLPPGETITKVGLIGQVESAGNSASITWTLYRRVSAAADVTSSAVSTNVKANTADADMAHSHWMDISGGQLISPIHSASSNETYSVYIIATTAANTDYDLQGVYVVTNTR